MTLNTPQDLSWLKGQEQCTQDMRNFVKERWNAALRASACMFLRSVEGCHNSHRRVGFPLPSLCSSQSVTVATQKLRAHKARSEIKDPAVCQKSACSSSQWKALQGDAGRLSRRAACLSCSCEAEPVGPAPNEGFRFLRPVCLQSSKIQPGLSSLLLQRNVKWTQSSPLTFVNLLNSKTLITCKWTSS